MNQAVRVLVPGKLMLFGEYTVLWEQECLAFSLDCHMCIEAEVEVSGSIIIESELWEEPLVLGPQLAVPDFAKGHLLVPLMGVLRERYPLPGLRIKISSGWDIADGLGSSSALSLGICLAVATLANPELRNTSTAFPGKLWECAFVAWNNQVKHQGFASGYDIACQLLGGLMGFRFKQKQWPLAITPYQASGLAEFVQVYSGGQGAPTKKVGSQTLAWIEAKKLKHQLISMMNAAKLAFIKAMQLDSSSAKQFAIHEIAHLRQFLLGGPCFPLFLEETLRTCEGFDKDFTYKTAGAGGEDSIILFGNADQTAEARTKLASLGWNKLDLGFPSHGARVETCTKG